MYARLLVILDDSVRVELSALLHVTNEWSRFVVLLSPPVNLVSMGLKRCTYQSDPSQGRDTLTDGTQLIDLLARTILLLDFDSSHECRLSRTQ